MKPRTFTILAVVLAVLGVATYVAGRMEMNHARDGMQRLEVASDARGTSADLDEAANAQWTAELEAIKVTMDRSQVLSRIGFGALMLALLANSMRVRLKHKAGSSAVDQRDGPASGDQPPIATTT